VRIYDLRFTIYDLRVAVVHGTRNTEHDPVKRVLTITSEPIDEAALLRGRAMSARAGAAVYFLGVVRGKEEDQTISAIEYEAFEEMARRQFNLLFDEMEKRWPVESVRLVHRVGVVKVNEPSLWVEVIAPHRGEAFAACQWLIDEMKRVVPIWKKPFAKSRAEGRESSA
jgi:molybdopterin synthase catalytic subunit